MSDITKGHGLFPWPFPNGRSLLSSGCYLFCGFAAFAARAASAAASALSAQHPQRQLRFSPYRSSLRRLRSGFRFTVLYRRHFHAWRKRIFLPHEVVYDKRYEYHYDKAYNKDRQILRGCVRARKLGQGHKRITSAKTDMISPTTAISSLTGFSLKFQKPSADHCVFLPA